MVRAQILLQLLLLLIGGCAPLCCALALALRKLLGTIGHRCAYPPVGSVPLLGFPPRPVADLIAHGPNARTLRRPLRSGFSLLLGRLLLALANLSLVDPGLCSRHIELLCLLVVKLLLHLDEFTRCFVRVLKHLLLLICNLMVSYPPLQFDVIHCPPSGAESTLTLSFSSAGVRTLHGLPLCPRRCALVSSLTFFL